MTFKFLSRKKTNNIRINSLCLIIINIIFTILIQPVNADEWTDTISDIRSVLPQNKHTERIFELLEKDPSNSYYYENLFELLYNQNRRDLALKLLSFGETRVTDSQRLENVLIALAHYELDLPAIEKAYREQIEEAFSRNRIPNLSSFPRSYISSDPVFQQHIYPELIQRAMKDTPESALVYEFLQKNTNDKVQLLALKRQRLAVVPNDKNAASGFANLAIEVKDYDLLVSDEVPESVTENSTFLYYKTQAYLSLNRKTEAIDTLVQAENVLVNAEFKNDFTWISKMYYEAGETEKAKEVALKYGRPGTIEQLQAFALVGDEMNAINCINILKKNHPPSAGVFFEAAKTIRPFDPNLADKTFDMAERFLVTYLKTNHASLSGISSDITAHYKKNLPRLYEAFLPIVATNKDNLHSFFSRIIPPSYKKDDIEPTLEFLKRHEKEYYNDWMYLYSYASLLELLERQEEALPYYYKAADLQPDDPLGMVSKPRPDDCIYRCLMAIKDYDTCETFIKENMEGRLGEFYTRTEQWDKAIQAYQNKNDYHRAFELILEHRDLDAAESYAKTIPVENRAFFDNFLLETKKDTAGLVKLARDRVASNPDDADLHAQLALRLFQNDQIAEARQEVCKAAELGHLFQIIPLFDTSSSEKDMIMISDDIALFQIIPFYDKNNIMDQLETDLKSLINRSNAHKANYLQHLGNYLSQNNHIEEAINTYEQTIILNPYIANIYNDIIDTLKNNTAIANTH